MAWSAKTTILAVGNLAGTPRTSSKVLLKAGETAHVQVYADFPVTPTDHVDVTLYTTLDDSAEAVDTVNWVDFTTVTIPNTTDKGYASFVVEDCYAFYVVLTRDGATDTISTSVAYRKDAD